MAEVDPVTGDPKIPEDKKDTKNEARFNVLKGKADQLAGDVASEKGQMILNMMQSHLLARINELIKADGQCMGIIKILTDMGITLDFGQMATEKLMQMVMKKRPGGM